jgi:hypothetical protein
MASEILGLFTSPEDYQMRQQQAQQNRALQFAQLNPFEKASYGIYQGAQQLGGATAGLFGMEDPQLRKISMRQQMLTGANGGVGIDLRDPNSMLRAAKEAQQFDPEFAQGLVIAANDLAKNMAEMRSKLATAAKTELSIAQEESLRKELGNLGPTPTNEQVLAVVSKYGSPEKILGVLQVAQTAQANREARKEEKQLTLDQQKSIEEEKIRTKRELAEAEAIRKKEAADALAQTQKERDAAERSFRLDLEKIRQDQKNETRALIEASKPPKTLNAGLQKDEINDLEKIDKADAQIQSLEGPIKNLTPDSKTKKPFLELGPVQNIWNFGRNVVSASSEQSRAYEELKSAIATAVNIKTSAEKGVQTDADVLRQAKALIAAGGGNDSEAARQALIRFRDAVKTDKEKTQKIIENRRKSQGVEPYGFSSGGTRTVPFSELK